MRSRLIEVRDRLKTDLAAGENRVRELEGQVAAMRDSLLRISGTIQAMNEMIAEDEASEKADAGQSAVTA